MNDIKYSIIIPVYNAQEYLSECLQSVEKQVTSRVEVICVNDGSKDESKQILDDYAFSHDFVRVLHKENAGVSEARNDGLKMAKGRYILFLDSDDLLEEHCLVMLDRVLENQDYDLILGRTRVSFDESDKETIYNLQGLTTSLELEEAITQFISAKDNLGIWAVWRHVYKRSFLKEHNILFNTKYSFGEDMDFIIRCLLVMKSYTLIDFPLVEYRIYNASVSGQYTLKSALSHLQVVSYWRVYFKDNPRIVSYFANKQLAMLPHVKHLDKIEKVDYFKQYALNDVFLNKAKGKFFLVYLVAKIFGYKRVSEWLG